MTYTAESWVKNVASVNQSGTENYAHVFFAAAYACEVRDSWFQGGGVNWSGLDYGVYPTNNASEILVENNVFVGMRHSMILAAGASGNVFGYNYSTAAIESQAPWWLSEDMCTHGAESYMNLFEGNIGGQIDFDDTHGGNAYNTAYRTWSLAFSSANTTPTSYRFAVTLEDYTYNANIVGCVLGRPGDATSADFHFGNNVQSTTYTEGNYSFVTGKATWNAGPVALPPSLYLPTKPTWWGTMNYPPIGPDVSPKNGTIPAQVRFSTHTL
jgi:hypothetical protein